MKIRRLAALLITTHLLGSAPSAFASGPRILKFSGVPMSQASTIKKRFPFVFEREVTLGEVDEIMRFLMSTGQFSNIEVIDRAAPNGRELVLVASLLRKIQDVSIEGNHVLATSEIQRILNIESGQIFERKNLLAAADELRRAYERQGYHNAKVEIDFDLPSDNEVKVMVRINEGEPIRISDVLIESPNADLSGRLNRRARSLKKNILTEGELLDFQKSVNEYLQDNRYLTARLSNPSVAYNADRTQAKLSYAIENPWRYEFFFEGNQHFTDGSIIRQLELDKLSGATSSPAPDLAEKIRRYYQAAGFANIEVDYNEKSLETLFKRQIRFKITENPRVRIKRIEVTGNISRPASYYAQFIKASSSDLIGAGFYNRKDIDDGSRRLITELQNQGFLRARVQSQRAEYSKDRSNVTIQLQIDEGPLTQVRQIRFEGVDAFQRSQLLDLLKIKAGAALSLKDLEESIQTLKDFYKSQGYLEMKIVNENEKDRIVTYNDTNTQANIEFQIYEGPRVTVGSIALQGNTFTKDYVIQRELSFEKGDVLTPEKIDESVFHLQRLGLFGRVSVRTLEEGTNIGERTVIVEVAERDPGLVTMGVGLTNERELTFRGYLGIAYRNLGGTGRAVSFRVDPKYSVDPRISYLENLITLSYLEPYIFGDRNRGRINLIREQAFSSFDKNDNALIQEQNTVGFLLERDLTLHTKLTYTLYSFSNQTQFERLSRATVETQNIAKTGPLVEFDYRDDIFNPTKGSYSFVNFEYSDPRLGSSEDEKQTINFIKTNASTTHYIPLTKKRDWVWATSVRGGYLANISTKPNGGVPYQETFTLGGRSTIRGFDSQQLERIPNYIQLGKSEYREFTLTSDSYYYLIKTELRFPLWRNSPLGDISGAIFYDGGAVLMSQPDVHIDDPYRQSAGLALRIATPVGPVNFEGGFKLNPRDYGTAGKESPFVIHISIGTF